MREILFDFLKCFLASTVPYKRDSLLHQLGEELATS